VDFPRFRRSTEVAGTMERPLASSIRVLSLTGNAQMNIFRSDRDHHGFLEKTIAGLSTIRSITPDRIVSSRAR
jgi:hypothetical protein